jgi:magnesium-transporting ATPase (P-type)
LSDGEAKARLERFGPNELPRARRPAYAAIALRQFTDPLVVLLIGAALVSALIGERVEAAAIAAIVLLNALLGFVQEARAEARCSRSATCSSSARASFAPAASGRSVSRSLFPVTSSS